MVRKILIVVLVIVYVLFILVLSACNNDSSDDYETYKYAYIRMFNGTVVEGICEKGNIGSNGKVDITINGITYTTHISNVIVELHKK